MSDSSGTTPERPATPDESAIPPADAVIPPPPPETPIPEGLLSPPSEITAAESPVLPETRRRSDPQRRRPRSALDGEQPAAVADDWARPSVAPEVPTSGGYRVLSIVIFLFLFVLLVAAVITIVHLLNTVGFPFAGDASSAAAEQFALMLRL